MKPGENQDRHGGSSAFQCRILEATARMRHRVGLWLNQNRPHFARGLATSQGDAAALLVTSGILSLRGVSLPRSLARVSR